MAQVEIKATKGDNEATISYDFGDSCADACEKFGEDVVLAGFMKSSGFIKNKRHKDLVMYIIHFLL